MVRSIKNLSASEKEVLLTVAKKDFLKKYVDEVGLEEVILDCRMIALKRDHSSDPDRPLATEMELEAMGLIRHDISKEAKGVCILYRALNREKGKHLFTNETYETADVSDDDIAALSQALTDLLTLKQLWVIEQRFGIGRAAGNDVRSLGSLAEDMRRKVDYVRIIEDKALRILRNQKDQLPQIYKTA